MTSWLIYISVTTAALLIVRFVSRKDTRGLPPGPKGRFLVGNLADFPQTDATKSMAYPKWRKDYGSVMHMEILGEHMIVLNTLQAVQDLMDKRAAIYSNRPRMVMSTEVIGNDWMLSSISGEPHKERRSVAQRYFLTQIKDWQHVQVESARTFLRNLYANPNNWVGLIRLSIASSVLQICYGHEVTNADDAVLKIVHDALHALPNDSYLVNYFPILKYYPSWLPGGGFKKDAAEAKAKHNLLRYTPFDVVCRQMAAGMAKPSFISTLLNQLPADEDVKHSYQAGIIRDAAAMMYAAAMDTTVSLMYTFLGAMVLYPETQCRAQSELDSVLDQERMPTFDDRTSLPFIDCIILEVLRWNAFTPLGFPHMVTEEDEYLGYRIPKGSTVFGNTWAILRDPEVFPNPDKFDPCRFLASTAGNIAARETVDATVYGWGRRACPGRHVGYSSLFILMSHILACFDVVKLSAEEPVLEFNAEAIVRRAQPVPCRLNVRSSKIATMLSRLE